MAANNFNYLNIEPIEEALSVAATNESSEKSPNSWLIWGGLAVLIIIVAIAIRARKRNGIDSFDNM
jgi:LPXTG-motif cell wall-anchored protein